jgi:hypothetical protein
MRHATSRPIPPHGKLIPEQAIVERYGGRVVFLPLVAGISTSEIIRRIQQGASASDNLETNTSPGWSPQPIGIE